MGPEGGLGDLREAELSQIGDNSPPTPHDVAIEGEDELCLATLISTMAMGDYGWSRNSVASQGNEVVVDGWVLYTQR